MFEVPEVPEALDEMHRRNARYGGCVSLESPGYEEAMGRCSNITGSGEVYDILEVELGINTSRTILLPEDIWQHGPYDRIPGDRTIRKIAGADVITFPDGTSDEAIADLRRVIPPTLPVPLSKGLIRKLLADRTGDKRRKDKIRTFLRTARGEAEREGDENSGPPITSDFDDDLLVSGNAIDEQTSRNYIRRLIADSRRINHNELTLFYGAEEALMTIAQACRRAFSDAVKISIPPHDYPRFIKFADFLGFKISPLGINYEDITRTSFDPDSNIFYLSSPRNPDGNILRPEEIRDLMSTLPERAVIIFDNTSISYEYGVDEYNATIREVMLESERKRGQKLIVVGSLSKEEQSPWLRIGYSASIDSDLSQQLRTVEAHISPNLGRVAANRLRWIEQRQVRTGEREYMRQFYESLAEIEQASDGRMRIYRPDTLPPDRLPSGYHCVIELPSNGDAETFVTRVVGLGQEIFSVPVKPPMRGSNQRTSIPTTSLNPDSFRRTGMQYMATSCFRLVTTGPAFQLTALAETLGIK